jgi:hypothetical protein
LAIALGLVRWLAPQLLGVSPDLQLVQIDKKVPPFFENVFRGEDFKSREYLIKDPITGVRAIPLYAETGTMGPIMGPNDLLGFRNYAISNTAKIVTIGDSQTYGNNVLIEQNWPGFMLSELKSKGASLYNMSVGGWAAPQYLNMLVKTMAFKPEVIVFAFYTGNDPLESFIQVYGSSYWRDLIPNKALTAADAPGMAPNAPREEWWEVQFKDGVKTVFTPTLRLTSNSDHPAVHAGYHIMADVARIIAESVADVKVKVFFTIIPSKELVYAPKVINDALQAPKDYWLLVEREKANLEQLAAQIRSYANVSYADVLQALQQSALHAVPLYPANENGHPVAAGYAVIGRVLAEAVKPHLSTPRQELATLEVAPGQFRYLLLQDNSVYIFASPDIIEKNGWPPGKVKTITQAEIADLPLRGVINAINPALYGPL